ncbi:coiled-coil domain-containing protein 191 isoform X2 [Brienomyrus brachyistius]|uniref:coiled-coil domain-containing protein 191 isoform X2 n=1 Tax=Brienomyrus brachyistius TaxID=42636 RepID=UPI0020B1A751|nr:coiled-coil domain-containing protein 191 isoform X2 [Brienomyrus brachyistius]
MAHFVPKPDLFRWKRITKNETHTKAKVNRDDIEQWRQTVESASQLAISQVLCGRRREVPRVGRSGQAIALRNQGQLRDHDAAFSEAQALLSDWMNSKLRLELEVGEDEDERDTDSPMSPSEQPGFLQYTNFDDLHSHLEQEADSSTAHTLLQELMQRTAVDCGILEESLLNTEREKRKQTDPRVTMEIRHQQVRERRTWLDAEREQRYREEALTREGRRERGRKEGSREAHQQDRRRQEALLEQEVVRLRKEMEEKRSLEQRMRYSTQKPLLWLVQPTFWFYSIHGGHKTVLCSGREQERMNRNRSNHVSSLSDPGLSQHSQNSQSSMQQDWQRLHRMQVAEAKAQLQGLRYLQSHFSAWHQTVLQQRLRMGKAAALSDWKKQQRAWRAWRLRVWQQQARREAEGAEEELRADSRCCQVALESNRRRLLRRGLAEWQAWCCARQQQRDLQLGREETRRKMAALVSAAAAGKLGGGQPLAPPSRPAAMHSTRQAGDADVLPTQHSAPCWLDGDALGNGLICQQQQEGISIKQSVQKEESQKQRMLGLKREANQEQDTEGSSKQRFLRQTRISRAVPRILQVPSTHPHPVVRAMEQRAKLRAERQREVQEMRKRREEEQLKQLRAAEEAQQREEEEEKQAVLERKREQRRQERERQLERQHRAERSRQLSAKALQYRCRALLLLHGLAPWRRLLELRRCQEQLAIEHHGRSVQRAFLLSWVRLMSECQAEREARADHFHKHLLLRRGLGGWLKLKNLALTQTLRADEFFRLGTLRKTLAALLVHMTREKLVACEQERRASEYSDRRVVQRCVQAWQTLPGLLRREREREQRRCRLRKRVAEILPDFRALSAATSWDLGVPSHSDF